MNDLTVGKESSVILKFAVPMLLGNVFQQLYNVIDSLVVGNFIGTEALSAVGASFQVMFVLISLILGFVMGSSIIISQYFGAKNYAKVKTTIDTMNISLFFMSVLVAILGVVFSRDIFQLIDLPESIMDDAVLYLNINMIGCITAFGYNSTSSILRGMGDSKTPLYFLIVSTFVNVFLDLVFVLIFHWGIAGVAWATVLAQGVSFISSVVYLNRKHEIIKYSFINLDWNKDIFIRSLKLGLPTGGQQLIVALGMTALQKIVNGFGTSVIAAYAISARIDSFAVLPAMNFSMALSSFVGQNIGANKIDRIRNGLWATAKMMATISLIISAISLLFPHYSFSVFTPDTQVIAAGVKYIYIVSPFYITFALMFAFNGVFRGSGNAIVPMLNTLAALWLFRVPSSYYLSGIYGERGIWMGIPIAWCIALALSYLYYLTGRWKHYKIATSPTE
jgi:putative MATE family efflux protein